MLVEDLFVIRHSSAGNEFFDMQRFLGKAVVEFLAAQTTANHFESAIEASAAKSALIEKKSVLRIAKSIDLKLVAECELSDDLLVEGLEALLGKAFSEDTQNMWIAPTVMNFMSVIIESIELNFKGLLQEKRTVFYVTSQTKDGSFGSQVFDSEGRELGHGSGKKKKDAEQNAAKMALKTS